MSAPLFGNSGFVYTTPGGILRTHALRWPLRDVEPIHRRRRYVRESLDMSVRQVVTIGSGVSEILATIRYEDLPEDLLTMLVHAADGVEIEYREDLRVSSTGTPFLLILDDPSTVHLAMDRDRYPSHGEYEVRVRLRRLDGWPPLPINTNELRNPGFEEGGAYWGVPLSTSWLGPGAGAEVEVADTTGAGRSVWVLPRTPISELGLTVGALASAACEAISANGGRATLGIAWEDAALNVIRYDTADTILPAWQRLAIEARPVPEGTVSVRLYIQSRDLNTARFRDLTFGPGATAPPYHSAAVRHDPARAHGGSRYLEFVAAGGQQVSYAPRGTPALDAPSRRFPVAAGDVAEFGAMAYRAEGDGQIRARLWLFDAAGSSLPGGGSDIGAPSVTVAEWRLSQRQHTIPAGAASARLDLQIFGGTTPTTARFDDVYLRIRRGS